MILKLYYFFMASLSRFIYWKFHDFLNTIYLKLHDIFLYDFIYTIFFYVVYFHRVKGLLCVNNTNSNILNAKDTLLFLLYSISP